MPEVNTDNQIVEYLDECYNSINQVKRNFDKLIVNFDKLIQYLDKSSNVLDKRILNDDKRISNFDKVILKDGHYIIPSDKVTIKDGHLIVKDDELIMKADNITKETEEVMAVLAQTNFKNKNSPPKMRIKRIARYMIENKLVEYKKLLWQFGLSVPQLSRDLSFLYSTGRFKRVRDSKTNLCQYIGKPITIANAEKQPLT